MIHQDRAAVDEGRLHRLAEDLDDAAVAGGEAVAVEPPPPELHAACDPLVDDGAAAGGAGQLGHPNVVAAVVPVGNVRPVLLKVADARRRVGQLLRELAGRRRVRGQPAEEVSALSADGEDWSFRMAWRQRPVLAVGDQVELFEHDLSDQDLAPGRSHDGLDSRGEAPDCRIVTSVTGRSSRRSSA